jgi:hypothetical protein
MSRLTDEEYTDLAGEYAEEAPELSGQPGLLTQLKQRALVNKLLDQKYARIVNEKASAMAVTPSEIIQDALRIQFVKMAEMRQ